MAIKHKLATGMLNVTVCPGIGEESCSFTSFKIPHNSHRELMGSWSDDDDDGDDDDEDDDDGDDDDTRLLHEKKKTITFSGG